MPKYFVVLKEVWERAVYVTAETAEEAEEKAFAQEHEEEGAFTFDSYLKDDVTVEETE